MVKRQIPEFAFVKPLTRNPIRSRTNFNYAMFVAMSYHNYPKGVEIKNSLEYSQIFR